MPPARVHSLLVSLRTRDHTLARSADSMMARSCRADSRHALHAMPRNDPIRATSAAWFALAWLPLRSRSSHPQRRQLPTSREPERPTLFELDVLPILSKAGCNSGACHGKARGQNGFALSLLGFDADSDYDAIVKNARGRRVFPGAVDNSLLLRKASGAEPHGGGLRLDRDGAEYATIRAWITTGMQRAQDQRPEVGEDLARPDGARAARRRSRATRRHGALFRRLDA